MSNYDALRKQPPSNEKEEAEGDSNWRSSYEWQIPDDPVNVNPSEPPLVDEGEETQSLKRQDAPSVNSGDHAISGSDTSCPSPRSHGSRDIKYDLSGESNPSPLAPHGSPQSEKADGDAIYPSNSNESEASSTQSRIIAGMFPLSPLSSADEKENYEFKFFDAVDDERIPINAIPINATPVEDEDNRQSCMECFLECNCTCPSCIDFSDRRTKYAITGIVTVAVIIAIALIAASLKRISSTQFGVEYDIWKKELEAKSTPPGLYFGPIGYRFVKFSTRQILPASVSDTCLSRDGLRIDFEVSYQYKIKQEHVVEVVEKYRNSKNWQTVAEISARSAMLHTCSEYNVTSFQSQRLDIQNRIYDNIQTKFDGDQDTPGLFATVTSVQLLDVTLPKEYKDAVTQKQRAEEDIKLAEFQREQLITRAETELMVAEKQAAIIKSRAETNAAIALIEANVTAAAAIFRFEAESYPLLNAKRFLELSTEGVLGYMANRLFQDAPSLDSVILAEPAIVSRKNLLQVD